MLKYPDIDPVIISVGPLAVSWYSLSYVVGIVLGWGYVLRLIKLNPRCNITKQHIDDFITWAIIGVIVGGRLGYVLFYDPMKYFAHPVDIFKTYMGGMSFHGGLIGYTSAAFFFARRAKISFLGLIDLSAAAVPIALFLGRIANFINAELYGRITDVPWAIVFPGSDYMPRHPSQLYEAVLEGFVLFCMLYIVAVRFNGLSKTGLLSGLFLIFYTIFRTIVEFFREPDVQLGFFFEMLTMGQLLSIPMLVLGIFLVYYSQRRWR
jgi:phosphatidylglycerol:prolipoprotein diacylglycerol transferase